MGLPLSIGFQVVLVPAIHSNSHTNTYIHKQTSGFVQDKVLDLVLYYGSYVFFSIKQVKQRYNFI